MRPRETPATLPPALLRAVRHPVTRCLIACLAGAAAAAAAEPARPATARGCPGR
ncbi:hypothetical protein [Kitasatospora sp. NPDC001547]|uniref:hypothetical protein n=1 Tax=Kitasatospora sp. NPDC001547 TaxID=3364015 RepID=UPI0036850EDA|nr:hypothetical protein KitaXyl93_12080 [Kitasatospora sp. Xyl93]